MSVPIHPSNSYPVDQKFLGSHSNSYSSYSQSPLGLNPNSLENDDLNQRQSYQNSAKDSVEAINEKRRKRRESHNAVERRRRDHINEKIQELSSLLPEFASDAQNKPNKGVILRRSVEYIRHMQLFAARQMDRTLELEQVLMRLCQQRGIDEQELGLTMPLGTPIQLPALSQNNNDMDDGDL
ncbi:helix-loop-helix DNA-binding domain-containing protein [Globomyces pollinis-pini]|nr:helix-loop-helix DNA-binding domain-containing protein [Globomyces pollinis-pini]